MKTLQTHCADIAIIGAGPAGASCAIMLKNSGLKVILIDKSNFPRDKVCGDALSLDVVNQLPVLSAQLQEKFEKQSDYLPSHGVRMFAPNLEYVDIPFYYQGEKRCGYVYTRFDFDNLLFQEAMIADNVSFLSGKVDNIQKGVQGIDIQVGTIQVTAKFVLGADGANSIVSRRFNAKPIDKLHHSAGLRVYYEGVKHFQEANFIELYFLKELLPGYLWVFPMANNRANVGLGVLSSKVSKKKLKLKEILPRLLRDHPALKERFCHAKPLERVKGHGLPLGSRKRVLSGDRYLLLGDAAGLIDPFTGEGIGNAIRSGRVAAAHVERAFQENDFSAAYNRQYDYEIYSRMWSELRMSRTIQHLSKYPFLFNRVVQKANRSPYWNQFLIQALSDVNHKKQFRNPGFYYRLLFQ